MTMTDSDSLYAVNTLPALAYAFDVYSKIDAPFKDPGAVEMILHADDHKKLLQKKGEHQVIVWFADGKVFARARCTFDKECDFNKPRVGGKDREGLKTLPWEKTKEKRFFILLSKWVMKLGYDYSTLIKALVAVCDKKVETPLTTKYDKTFNKFNEYRKVNWPDDVSLEDRQRFLEEVLVRVSFWFKAAAEVDALK
ncbi:MAG: hypothetical protein GF309_13540 [Candidatus Lokiarchaeota archaeon]|nr:hypothetical protein [Candidatus Lokiarchaeota archaeon]